MLERILTIEKEKNRITRVLSSHSKKNEIDLLMTKSDFFREMKEKRELNEASRPLDEKYGNHTWLMSLRRPVDFEGTRFVNVNIGTSERPIWQVVKEYISKETERIRKPKSGVHKKTISFFSNSGIIAGPDSALPKTSLQGDKLDELEVMDVIILGCWE